MTIQEAKEFYFRCLCSDYNMFNADEAKYAEFNNLIDPDTKKKFFLEYMDVLLKRVYDEPEKSAFSFNNVLTKLGKRASEFKPYAKSVVQIFEECPFPDNFAKLMVMESIVGSGYIDGWGSGYSILCFYDDYSERIWQASKQYIDIAFDQPVPEYYKSACLIPVEVMNDRAKKVRALNDERFNYVRSDEFRGKRNKE